ncbi:hypothetical protein C8R44DRAFT_813346 [Mycena epipterygia]|nr:hypothetical protein C8R44DRAFT_813346 [Mycena epipterygia]
MKPSPMALPYRVVFSGVEDTVDVLVNVCPLTLGIETTGVSSLSSSAATPPSPPTCKSTDWIEENEIQTTWNPITSKLYSSSGTPGPSDDDFEPDQDEL